MEIVTVRFQEDVLKKIDESISKNNFNSRTEFIRDAVRNQISALDKKVLIREFMKFRGRGKKTTPEENAKVREEVGKELVEEFEKRFSGAR